MGAAKDLNQNIQFMFNNEGKKTYAVLPIDLFEDMFEDYQDWLSIQERKDEPRVSLEDVEASLKKNGKL
jgi:hypothetical protein